MFRFVKQGDIVLKQQIVFDENALRALENEIIDNCSIIEHKEYDGCYPPLITDSRQIRNLKQVKIGTREYKEAWPDQHVYHISFDEYTYPKLAKLLQQLLRGNLEALEEILNPKLEADQKSFFEEKLRQLSDEIDNTPNNHSSRKINLLTKLQDLEAQAKLNASQVSESKYYSKVQELIRIETIDSITIQELKRIKAFLGAERILFPINIMI